MFDLNSAASAELLTTELSLVCTLAKCNESVKAAPTELSKKVHEKI